MDVIGLPSSVKGKTRTPSTRSNGSSWAIRLGDAIRARRTQLALTQLELARLAGCGPAFLYDLERGKRTIRLDKLFSVLRILGLEVVLRPGHGDLRVEDDVA